MIVLIYNRTNKLLEFMKLRLGSVGKKVVLDSALKYYKRFILDTYNISSSELAKVIKEVKKSNLIGKTYRKYTGKSPRGVGVSINRSRLRTLQALSIITKTPIKELVDSLVAHYFIRTSVQRGNTIEEAEEMYLSIVK